MANIRQKLPVTYLLFAARGRITRPNYWFALILVFSSFYILDTGLNQFFGPIATWLIYPPFFWSLFALSSKRLHDLGKSSAWLALLLVPLLGQVFLLWELLFRRGPRRNNAFGPPAEAEVDYLVNDDGLPDPGRNGEKWIINDVTKLNPVAVRDRTRPESVEELQAIVRTTSGPISVGGGRFSMGGQTASADSAHLDLRGLNKVLAFSKEEKWIRVQAGIRWCDIQH